ncbi:helix-turn-helix domain-containing protein [Acidithiobacillus ferridurans]|nr:helix-turn-helix domain-containing protein [Acidithiobacillus ferridurans]MBU2825132.1 helix-turn-helix domain-containing protein [Acidithiobacillus ferrooxidans]
MGERYHQLSVDERNQLQRGLNAGQSLRALSRIMNRSPGTLSRECRRGGTRQSYDAVRGRDWAQTHRRRGLCRLLNLKKQLRPGQNRNRPIW